MSIDWTLAGTVILSGLIIVFLVLFLLILLVQAMGKVVGGKMSAPASAPAPIASPAVPAPILSAPAPTAAADDGQVIAVISAAVSAYMQDEAPGVPYAVTAVTPKTGRSRDLRPAWGFAGMRQNTEPF